AVGLPIDRNRELAVRGDEPVDLTGRARAELGQERSEREIGQADPWRDKGAGLEPPSRFGAQLPRGERERAGERRVLSAKREAPVPEGDAVRRDALEVDRGLRRDDAALRAHGDLPAARSGEV